MNEKQDRRFTDNLKKWVTMLSIVISSVAIMGIVSNVFSKYFTGIEYIKKVDGIEIKVDSHEKKIIDIEKFIAVQNKVNENLERYFRQNK